MGDGFQQITASFSADSPLNRVSKKINHENNVPTKQDFKDLETSLNQGAKFCGVKNKEVTSNIDQEKFTLVEFGLTKIKKHWSFIKDEKVPWMVVEAAPAAWQAKVKNNNPSESCELEGDFDDHHTYVNCEGEWPHSKGLSIHGGHSKGVEGVPAKVFGLVSTQTYGRVFFEKIGFQVKSPQFAFQAQTDENHLNWEAFNTDGEGYIYVGNRNKSPIIYINGQKILSYVPVEINAGKDHTNIKCSDYSSEAIPEKNSHNASLTDLDWNTLVAPIKRLKIESSFDIDPAAYCVGIRG
jgi:hypothetical protein